MIVEPKVTRWTEEHVELRFANLQIPVEIRGTKQSRTFMVTGAYVKLRRKDDKPWQGARWSTRVSFRQVLKDGTLGKERNPQLSPRELVEAVLPLLPDEFSDAR